MNYPNSDKMNSHLIEQIGRLLFSFFAFTAFFARMKHQFLWFRCTSSSPSTSSQFIPHSSELLKRNFSDAMKEAHEFLFYSAFARRIEILANGAELMFESVGFGGERQRDLLLHDKENRKIVQWIKFPFRFPDSLGSLKIFFLPASSRHWLMK